MEDKQVKYTDYGEEYNRESMYETVRDVLMDGYPVIFNGEMCLSLDAVIYKDGAIECENIKRTLNQVGMHTVMGNWTLGAILNKNAEKRIALVTALQQRVDNARQFRKDAFNQREALMTVYGICNSNLSKSGQHSLSPDKVKSYYKYLCDLEDSYLAEVNNDACDTNSYEKYSIIKANREALELFDEISEM